MSLSSVYKGTIRVPLRKAIKVQSRAQKEFHVDLSEKALLLSGVTKEQIATIHAEASTFREWDVSSKKLKFDNKFALDRAVKLIFKQLKQPTERERANNTGNIPSPIDYRLTRGSSKKVGKPSIDKTTVTLKEKVSITSVKATSELIIDIPSFGLQKQQQQAIVTAALGAAGRPIRLENAVISFLSRKWNTGKSVGEKKAEVLRVNEASALSTRYVQTQTIAKPKLTDTKNQFTSANSILQEINKRTGGSLHNALKANMVTPKLVYRTGRFARSVKLTKAKHQGTDVTLYYKRHGFPYSLFENPGYRNFTQQRRPDKLIEQTVRELAIGIVSTRFNLKIVRE